MADQKVNIDIRTRGAKKSKQDISGLSSSIGSLGRSALNAGAAYFGARGLIQGLMESTRLAGVQEQAEKSLEVALGKRSQALLDQASALQKVTTFGDEAIIGVQASLAAFLDSEEQIKLATEATLDLSVAMGMDLKSAGDLIAKTLGSSTNAMSRYGVEVEGAVGSTERIESLTNNVAKLFGGQAAAQAQTYAGSVQQLKNQLGDMGEQIGRIVIPVFEELAPHLRTAIDFWSKYLDVGKETEGSQNSLSKEIVDLNKKIELQASLVDYISGTSYRTFDLMKVRASEASRDLKDQMTFENLEIIKQREQLELLNQKKRDQLDILAKEKEMKSLINIDAQKGLDIKRSENDLTVDYVENKGLETMEGMTSIEVGKKYLSQLFQISDQKKVSMQQDLKNAALSGQSAKDAMKSVVRAESMEAVAGYISSVLKTVPFPVNLVLAAGAGAVVSSAIDRNLAMFADGGVVQGNPSTGDSVPAMLTPGEVILNASQQQGLLNNMGGVTVNIQGNMIGNEEFVRDTLIPEIDRTVNRGLA